MFQGVPYCSIGLHSLESLCGCHGNWRMGQKTILGRVQRRSKRVQLEAKLAADLSRNVIHVMLAAVWLRFNPTNTMSS